MVCSACNINQVYWHVSVGNVFSLSILKGKHASKNMEKKDKISNVCFEGTYIQEFATKHGTSLIY